jgi:hypothetical protein
VFHGEHFSSQILTIPAFHSLSTVVDTKEKPRLTAGLFVLREEL